MNFFITGAASARRVSAVVAPWYTEGRSIRANVGLELKGVSWS
jgi:hypothetical protein